MLPDGTKGYFSEFTSVKQSMMYHSAAQLDHTYSYASAILKFTAVGGAYPATGSFFVMVAKDLSFVKAQMLADVYAPKWSQCMWKVGSSGQMDRDEPGKYNCLWHRDQVDASGL